MKDFSNKISITQAKATLKRGLFLDDEIYIIDNLDMNSFPSNKRITKGFLFILCERGCLQCEIDQQTYRAQRNSIFLLHTNDCIENITFPTSDFCGKAILIAPKVINHIVNVDEQVDFLQKLSEIHHFSMKEYSVSNFKYVFLYIRFILLKKNQKVKKHVYYMAKIIIDNLREDMKTLSSHSSEKEKEKNKYMQIHDTFLLFLKENNYRFAKINFFCKRFNISYMTLERAIKKTTGITPHEYQRKILTQKMCASLCCVPFVKITKIADDFHFQSESAFARYFKKEMNISPIDYRKNKCSQLSHPVPDTTLPQT